MKKIIPGFIILLLIASCGLESPQKITIKGNPALYIPLGSPFAGMEKKDRLENLIGPDNIKKMMNASSLDAGAGDELIIYEVSKRLANTLATVHNLKIDSDVQIYMAHYRIMEMPLNLKTYADEAMTAVRTKREITIPAIPPGLPVSPAAPLYINGDNELSPTEDPNSPFLKIPLAKMAKLVKVVKDGKYGLEIEIGTNTELATNLQLKIPGFGITGYINGTLTDNNTKLQYVNASKVDFYPQKRDLPVPDNKSDLDDGENLWVYAKITGPCSGELEPAMIFEWTQALIDTTSEEDLSTFMGSYPIENSLSEFLGDGVTFKNVYGFMYMSGVKTGTDASLIAKIYDADKFNNGDLSNAKGIFDEELHSEETPVFSNGDEFDEDLYPMSITNGKPLELEVIFSSEKTTLQYAIKIVNMWYDNNNNETSIKFDMVILIPLDLKVSNQITDSNVDSNIRNNYVMLDLKQFLKDDSKEDDLLGRKEGDDYLKYIEYVNIGIKNPDINIIDATKLAVLVTTTPKNGQSSSEKMEFRNNAFLKFTGASLNEIPFSPKFIVLLKKDDNQEYGSFKINRPPDPSFDFNLYVEAKAALEYTMDL